MAYSDSDPAEEGVIQNHYNDLQVAIIHPLSVASKLLQEGVVGKTLVSEVSTQGRSQVQNSTAILSAVTASIHNNPELFQVFMSVLEDSPETANLAKKMRNQLTSNPGSTERLMENKGRRYTVSAEYKEAFVDLQDSFGKMYTSLCATLESQVSETALKDYLCKTFPELVIPLKDAIKIDDIMKIVRDKSSLTDVAYFKVIAKHFDLEEMKQHVEKYRRELDSFCERTLNNHSYVRSFREDHPRYIHPSDKIEFQLQWNSIEKTMKDIRDVLQKGFGQLADRVQIVVIEVGSVVVVCCAPRYLMKELARLATNNAHELAAMGVVKLTIGGTEVIIEKVSGESQGVHPTSEMSQSQRMTVESTCQTPGTGLMESLLVPDNLTALLTTLTKCLKEFISKITSVVGDAVDKINELGDRKITLETKTACRELLNMLLLLSDYMKQLDNFAWYAKHEERKATVLDALRQDEPNFEPLNGYLKQLMRCLERAEASFRKFEDHCNGKSIIQRLSEAHEGFKSEADKPKLAEGASGAFSSGSAIDTGAGGVALAGVPTLGLGTIIGFITGVAAPMAFGGSVARLTHVIGTEFKDKKKALILLGICIGEISGTAASIQHTAKRVQQGLKEVVEHIEYFDSCRDSQMESVIKFFEELESFATTASECKRELDSKQQDLESSILTVIGKL